MHSVFQAWHFMTRVASRRICFKGGGSSEVPETEAQKASAEVAMKNYNDYMSVIRPFEEKYVADVTGDNSAREARVGGQINADIAQKVGTPAINPNRGMAPESVATLATTTAGAQVKGQQVLNDQQASGFQSVIDMGQGKATQAQQGMAGLASQSVDSAVRSADSQQKSRYANLSAGATGAMAAGGMAEGFYKDSKGK